MGTQQELTTEQISLLLMIEGIETYEEKNPGSIPAGGIKEVLDSSNVMEADDFDRIAETLEYYGYLHRGDELTIDGKQYIALFKEYLEEKTNNPVIVHNSFSLINIGKVQMDIEACLGKIDFALKLDGLSDSLKSAVQAVKNWLHK